MNDEQYSNIKLSNKPVSWVMTSFNGSLIFQFADNEKGFPNAWHRFWLGFFFGWKFRKIAIS